MATKPCCYIKNSRAENIHKFSRLLVSAETSNLENLYMCWVRLWFLI